MANAPALWPTDNSMSSSRSGWASGLSVSTRSTGHTGEVPFAMPSVEPPTTQSRCEPTALRHKTTGFRRGAEPPQKSSLPFFVFVGLVVGLFAFGMMSFCLPDPMDQIAAREAKAAQTFPPPPPIPVEVAPVLAPPAPPAPPAQIIVTTIAQPATAKVRAARGRHGGGTKKAKTLLPSNPYAE